MRRVASDDAMRLGLVALAVVAPLLAALPGARGALSVCTAVQPVW